MENFAELLDNIGRLLSKRKVIDYQGMDIQNGVELFHFAHGLDSLSLEESHASGYFAALMREHGITTDELNEVKD